MTSLCLVFIDDVKLFGDYDHPYNADKLVPFAGPYVTDETYHLKGRFLWSRNYETYSGLMNVEVIDSSFNGILVKDCRNIKIYASFDQMNEENKTLFPRPQHYFHLYDNPLDDSTLVLQLFSEKSLSQ